MEKNAILEHLIQELRIKLMSSVLSKEMEMKFGVNSSDILKMLLFLITGIWITEDGFYLQLSEAKLETYAYGLPEEQRNDYEELVKAMDNRFGHKAMKESYVAEAKLRRKKEGESYRDFAQCLEDLYRRAHPESREYVQECSLKTFLDNCSEMENFRLAVRRTRPKTLQEAVTTAMQEDCIRISEKQNKDPRIFTKPRVFQVSQWNDGNNYIDNKRSGVKKTCYRCNSTQHLIRNCPVNSNLKTGSAVEGGARFDKKQLNSGRPRQ